MTVLRWMATDQELNERIVVLGVGDFASRKLDKAQPKGVLGKIAVGAAKAARGVDRAVMGTLDSGSHHAKSDNHCRMLARRHNKECGKPLDKQGETCGNHICANEYTIRAVEYGGTLGASHKMGAQGRKRKYR